MVKTNSKKSVIALVVMAILLVLSMAMTITGAWFTDSLSQQTGSLTFGKIDIEWNATNGYSFTYDCEDESLPVMPGCTLTLAGVIDNKEEAAYVAYKVSLAFSVDVGLTAPEGWTYSNKTLSIDKVVAVDAAGTLDIGMTVEIPELLGNAAQGATATFTLDVAAVQQAHMASAPADYAAVVALATASEATGA